MALSLEKLHGMLHDKGFLPVAHFQYHGLCRYIEIVCKENAECFLLTVSSRFEMASDDNAYKLKSIPVDSSGLIPEKYARLPSNFEISNLYEDINLSKKQSQDTIEKQLLEGYKKTIQLDNTVDGNIDALKENFNQLKRLEQCVNNLEYRISIFHKVWLSVLNKESEVECYMVKDYAPSGVRKFLVTIDLESFLKNMATVPQDIEQINLGVAKVLDKNMNANTGQFYSSVRNCPVLTTVLQKVQKKRKGYADMIEQFRSVLEFTKRKEKELMNRLSNGIGKDGTIYSDMDNARNRTNMEKELQKLVKSREDVIGSIIKIRQRDRSLVLIIDRILFDNVVMLSTVNRNLAILNALCDS
jgi:hypothetical protein